MITQELLTHIVTALASGGVAWLMQGQKLRRERARLGAEQYQDVSTLVERYIADLAEMSAKIESLHRELTDARQELNRLRKTDK